MYALSFVIWYLCCYSGMQLKSIDESCALAHVQSCFWSPQKVTAIVNQIILCLQWICCHSTLFRILCIVTTQCSCCCWGLATQLMLLAAKVWCLLRAAQQPQRGKCTRVPWGSAEWRAINLHFHSHCWDPLVVTGCLQMNGLTRHIVHSSFHVQWPFLVSLCWGPMV